MEQTIKSCSRGGPPLFQWEFFREVELIFGHYLLINLSVSVIYLSRAVSLYSVAITGRACLFLEVQVQCLFFVSLDDCGNYVNLNRLTETVY